MGVRKPFETLQREFKASKVQWNFLFICENIRSKKQFPMLRPPRIWEANGVIAECFYCTSLTDVNDTRKRQSCQKLVTGNLIITHSQEKSTNWSRKPSEIPWALLASLLLSVVVLTLKSLMMGVNPSASALNQQSFPVCGGHRLLASPQLAGCVCEWIPLEGKERCACWGFRPIPVFGTGAQPKVKCIVPETCGRN